MKTTIANSPVPANLSKVEKTYLSFFSGAGIGCHGLTMAGFNCVATVENIKRRLEIQRHNNKCLLSSGYICGDITLPETREKIFAEMQKWGLDVPGKLDVAIATPPCQGMSVCNHKKGAEKSQNSLIVEAIYLVAQLRPKIFVFENTALFWGMKCTLHDGKETHIGEAITEKLGETYNILPQRINLKNYGCPSSRTRFLVIGTDKKLWFSPLSIIPDWRPEVTLRQLIGDLPPLSAIGQIAKGDVYHSAKLYSKHMRAWISSLREGESAFGQPDLKKRPHRIIAGKRIENKNANGDKYKRQKWDAVAPCVHTRNDIFSSQNTVHPSDDRVFSIREIMRMMSVPSDFKWSEKPATEISSMSLEKKRQFLRANEMNIRQCLGEAVPTEVLKRMAEKAIACLSYSEIPHMRKSTVSPLFALPASGVKARIGNDNAGFAMENLLSEIELANVKRNEHAAFYTPPIAAFRLLRLLPDLRPKKRIRILEPAVGIGRLLHFLPILLAGYEEVQIDAMDIDARALDIAQAVVAKASLPSHVKINYLCGDFLDYPTANGQYDLIVGNPPFGRISSTNMRYRANLSAACGSRNLFGLFLAKSLKIARHVVMIAPKSFLNAPDFAQLRAEINAAHTLRAVCDFGETGFKGVRIETMAFAITTNKRQRESDLISIESVPQNMQVRKTPNSVFNGELPYWLLYRNEQFDQMLNKMQLGIFDVFRDRQISKRHFCNRGTHVLKSANIGSLETHPTKTNVFVSDISRFAVRKFMNRQDVLLVPNLSYNTRACRLPKNKIVDGSVAILHPRNGLMRLKDNEVRFFASEEFRNFYRVARNHGTRSLNIDAASVFFFGKKRSYVN